MCLLVCSGEGGIQRKCSEVIYNVSLLLTVFSSDFLNSSVKYHIRIQLFKANCDINLLICILK